MPETNAQFKIEIKDAAGQLVSTLHGNVANGLIEAKWDLVAENGDSFTNDNFTGDFTVLLPDGHSRTLQPQNYNIGRSWTRPN